MSPRLPTAPLEPSIRTLPDRLADELIARIFTGELQPNERLSPERALAEELGVDRTSLRVALRQLSRMNLLRATQGSGITVLDYRRHAGIDFIAAVLEVPGLELGSALLLEALDQWNAMMPRFAATALARAKPAELVEIDAFFEAQLRALDAPEPGGAGALPGVPSSGVLDQVTELEVALQDRLVDVMGDVTLRLVANSTRGVRRKLTRLQFDLVNPRAQCQAQRTMFQGALTTKLPAELLLQAHAAYLSAHHQALRAHILTLPQRPYRTSSWNRTAL
mgnify:CR=1 FL=1